MAKYNLNKRKSTKVILLILALTFVAAPVVGLAVYLIALLLG